MARGVNYFIKLRARDLKAFNQMHTAQVIALLGCARYARFFVINEVKSDG